MELDAKKLISLTVTFASSVTAGALFAVDTSTNWGFILHLSLIIMSLLSLTMVSLYIYRQLIKQKRYILQGEDIDNYERCGFGKKDDPKDETGTIIVNLRERWKLVGNVGPLGVLGTYLANIRFKKLVNSDNGHFSFTIFTNENNSITTEISLSDLPFDEFAYLDVLFDYDGTSNIKFAFEPDNETNIKEVVGFDRLEAYLLPKAAIIGL